MKKYPSSLRFYSTLCLLTIFSIIAGLLDITFLVDIIKSRAANHSISTLLMGCAVSMTLITGMLYMFYKEQKKAFDDIETNEKVKENSKLDAYIKANSQALEKFKADTEYILATVHSALPLYRPIYNTMLENSDFWDNVPKHAPFDVIAFKKGLSPHQTAEKIVEIAKLRGENIFPSKDLNPAEKFNKLMFGSYDPSRYQKVVNTIVIVVSLLFAYGLSQAFVGPLSNLFIPSDIWTNLARPLVWISFFALSILTFTNKKAKSRLAEKIPGRTKRFLLYPLIILLYYFVISIVLNAGAPRLTNDILGKEAAQLFVVTKDMDTRKKSGRHHYIDAYCVKVITSSLSFPSENTYCLNKADWETLPQGMEIGMRFVGQKSFSGFEISGYLPGYKPANQMR